MTGQPTIADIDWTSWLHRYDAQQEVYTPARERRFDLVIDLVETHVPPEASVLDIGAGPGSLAARLLARLPGARCVALDADPVMIELGRRSLGDVGGRLRWVRTDVLDEDWRAALGEEHVDAAVSSAALHWLPAADLVRVYREIAQLLSPGAVFVNADLLLFPAHLGAVQKAVGAITTGREAAARASGAEDWDEWWKALEAQGVLDDAFAERARSSLLSRRQRRIASAAFHEAALDEAGFREVAVVWQDLEERVLLAIR